MALDDRTKELIAVGASVAGNPVARTEQVWQQYHSKLHGFIQKRVGDAADAEDILQDVFMKIHSRIGTLRDSEKIHAWIYRIAGNVVIDHYRTHKTAAELPEPLPASEGDADDKAQQELAGCIRPMIDSLPEHYRKALMLSEIEGLTQKEMAAQLGLSLPGAKARIRRGRAMLKDMLLQCCHFEFDRRGAVVDYDSKGEGCECDTC